MGLMDMIFGNQEKERQPQATPVDPNAINPIYGVPEALIQEMKREQQKADMGNAFANMFGGAANIARGIQGGPPIYDGAAASDPNAAMDGLAKRVMMFSQLRQNYEQQAQAAAMKKMLPDVAKKLGVPVEALAQLPDAEKTKYIMAAMTPVAPEQVNIKVPQGEVTALKIVDPVTKSVSYRSIDGQPLNMASVTEEAAKAKAQQTEAEVTAKMQAENRVKLPSTLNTINEANNLVTDILNDPNLPKAVGNLWDRRMSLIPGTPEYGTAQKLDQLKGKGFVQGIMSIKGTGPVANAEGLKAENAYARMQSAQNEQDFRKAMADLQASLSRSYEIAHEEAGLKKSSQGGSEWTDLGNGLKFRKVGN